VAEKESSNPLEGDVTLVPFQPIKREDLAKIRNSAKKAPAPKSKKTVDLAAFFKPSKKTVK